MRLVDWPWALGALVGVGMVVWWRNRRQVRGGSLRFSDITAAKQAASVGVRQRNRVLTGLRGLAVLLAVGAVGRPQAEKAVDEIVTEGIDIMLAIDVSGSMETVDSRLKDQEIKNRVDVAKEVIEKFVKGLKNDRVGLVVFAAESFTQCPLTLDYGVLLNFLKQVEPGMKVNGQPRIDANRTAIGLALATCVNRLKDSKAKSKVIILLTDGRNNAGEVDPPTAAKVAKALGVRVYSIGTGSKEGMVLVSDPLFGERWVPAPHQDLDERTLKEIAEITGGKYYRATDPEALTQVYQAIWQLEKTRFPVKEYQRYRELFPYLLLPALGILLLEMGLANTVFRKVP